MVDTEPLNRTAAKTNPAAHFKSPAELADNPLMTLGEKLSTLKLWRTHVLQELSAATEGMPTNKTSARHASTLEAIERAIKSLSEVDPA